MFGMGGGELVIVAVVLLLGMPFYFLPSMVAAARRHSNLIGVLLINAFFGWTVIGWIGALVWALTAPSRPADAVTAGAGGTCARCGAPLASAWRYCPMCGEQRAHAATA